jgi:hypothetical protein
LFWGGRTRTRTREYKLQFAFATTTLVAAAVVTVIVVVVFEVKKTCVAKHDVYVKLSFFAFALVSGKAACFLQSPRTLVLLLVVCTEREREEEEIALLSAGVQALELPDA